MAVTVTTNLPDFKRQMRELGQDFERKVFRAGTSAAATVFRKLAVNEAPVLKRPKKGAVAGLLRRAVYVKRARAPSGTEHYFVGVRQGKSARARKGGSLDAYYWRWVHEGHLARGPGSKIKGGRRRSSLERRRLNASGAKRVPGNPFLARAFARGKDAALNAFTERVTKRIALENRKRTT
jgi:hypothetical protein